MPSNPTISRASGVARMPHATQFGRRVSGDGMLSYKCGIVSLHSIEKAARF
ncbi:MAG: hypothetical protein LBD58_05935 [Treponema sp.]|nr:hypothetical protein [Treponema sp.]